VIRRIPTDIAHIICVDDCCPSRSGEMIEQHCTDTRVRVVIHTQNQGVGGAMVSGYREALKMGADIVVKLDGDGQMDPASIPRFVQPILDGRADYTKGNRFYHPESVSSMPAVRLLGNAILSFMAKASTGYWRIFDPTNGYTAIHATSLRLIPLDKLSRRYFFETDLLFRLNTVRAMVVDVPMDAVYGTEESNLSPSRVLLPFLCGHLANLAKRFVYGYLLRDFSVASLLTLIGIPLLMGGLLFGSVHWMMSIKYGIPASAGTVMLAALPIVLGIQALLTALSYDIANTPTVPLQRALVTMQYQDAHPSRHVEFQDQNTTSL
jgi:dolichol-phosphate mannosyltransferase